MNKKIIISMALIISLLIMVGIYFSIKSFDNNLYLSNSADFNDLDLNRRKAIFSAYPDFVVNYEDQPCFAGCSVKVFEDSRDYYYVYYAHTSGLPIGVATCFKVDPMMKVYKVWEFPDFTDSYIGYQDVDQKTCKGIK